MNSALAVLKVAFRAATWRATPDPRLVGLPSLPLSAFALIALRVALQIPAGAGGGFNPYGINAAIAWITLEIAVAALFVPPGARTSALSAMLILTCVAELASAAAKIAVALVPALAAAIVVVHERAIPFAIFAVVSLWWIGAMVAVLRSFAPRPRLLTLARAAALWAALLTVSAVVPHAPIFVGRDFDIAAVATAWPTGYINDRSRLVRISAPGLDCHHAA